MNIAAQLIINGLISGAFCASIAISFSLIYGATKFFNLAHGVIVVLGGYIVFFFSKIIGWNIWVSIMLGIFLAGLIGYALEKIIYLPLRKKKASNMILLVASLGVFTALQALIALAFSSQFQSIKTSEKIYELSGAFITRTQIIMIIAPFIILLILGLVLKKTMFGKAIKAISDDEEAAKIIGLDTNKIIGYVFFIGSAIAGLAGIINAFDSGLEPQMGLKFLLWGIAAAIVGGVGSLYGALIGAFLLSFISQFGVWFFAGEWQNAIAFSVLILFLIFRPQGIIKN